MQVPEIKLQKTFKKAKRANARGNLGANITLKIAKGTTN